MSQSQKRRVLIVIAVAELLAKSLWFSGTAVIPQLSREWNAGLGLTSWLTISVQLGFVAGALLLAAFNLLDLFSSARIFVVASLVGAFCNALFAVVATKHVIFALFLRFLTGAVYAGVYPTGMKFLTGWFRRGRGLAMGIIVGAITVGSALPHAVHIGHLPWRGVVMVCSGFSLVAALLVAFGVKEGPYHTPQPRFDFHQITEALRNRRLRLANFGYLGHMWELYSMWGWITILLAASGRTVPHSTLETISFLAVASGFVGCVWAGYASDNGKLKSSAGKTAATTAGATPQEIINRRARVTILAMAASGACCVLAAIFFNHFEVLVAICLLWGVSVVADSAQFSTIVSEVSDQRYVGTALTMQTALGFLLTSISIRLVADVGAAYGWRWGTLTMGIGPALGIIAMLRLQRVPTPAPEFDDETLVLRTTE